MVLDYTEGGTLSSMLNQNELRKQLDFSVYAQIATGVCSGLVYLHEAMPPVTCNLSCDTVMLDADMRPRIMLPTPLAPSPGAAAVPPSPGGIRMSRDVMTRTSAGRRGSEGQFRSHPPNYFWSPERLRGGLSTPQTDVYAFGILLFWLFAKEDPFEEKALNAEDRLFLRSPEETLRQVAEVDIRPTWPAAVPMILREVAIDCWHRSAARRPPMAETADSLKAAIKEAGSKMAAQQDAEKGILEDVLPAHVVAALKAGKKVEPERFEAVTIFFRSVRRPPDVRPAKLAPRLLSDPAAARRAFAATSSASPTFPPLCRPRK